MTPLLLVRAPGTFADDLVKTGVKDFIVPPFHFQRGRFIANTRDAAVHLMAQKLSSDSQTFREAYLRHYRNVREVLTRTLPETW